MVAVISLDAPTTVGVTVMDALDGFILPPVTVAIAEPFSWVVTVPVYAKLDELRNTQTNL